MIEIVYYTVPQPIAERAGLMETRYRTKEGLFILNNRDLSRVRFAPEEYTNGLSGVTQITKEEADALIKENNYKMGLEGMVAEEAPSQETESEEATNENEENVEPQNTEEA